MTKFTKPDFDELLLNHELEFILDSPITEFQQYLQDNNQEEAHLTYEFDQAVAKLSNNMATPSENNTIQKKRFILEDLIHHASSIGLTIDLTLDDIPTLEENDLDLLILQFISSVDTDSEDEF